MSDTNFNGLLNKGAGVAAAILTVFTNITSPEDDAAFNDWYDNTHLKDVLRVPGFVAATRYRISAVQPKGVTRTHDYLSVYELESDDLQGALDALTRAGREMIISKHIDGKRSTAFLYEEITPRVMAEPVA